MVGRIRDRSRHRLKLPHLTAQCVQAFGQPVGPGSMAITTNMLPANSRPSATYPLDLSMPAGLFRHPPC